VFGTVPGEVAVGVVADSLRRSRIQVDVGALAPDEPGRPCRVLSLRKPLRYKGMNSLVTLSGYTGPRAACREGVRLRSGRYSLVTAGGP
jgi:hypothetical protein